MAPPIAPPPPLFDSQPKKALAITKKANTTEHPPPDDARDQLLAAIKGPKNLKHVEEAQKGTYQIALDDSNVLNLIAKALVERRQKVKDEAEEGSEDDNLEDWL